MRVYITHSAGETEELAQQIAQCLQPGDCIAYTGGLGMGKTAFTRGLAEGLGIDSNMVSSPTFALVNEYRGGGRVLCHFDMYRVNGFDDLYSTGFFDYLDTDAILAIEWSENISDALPPGTITIAFEQLDDTTRRITVEGDERF